jgi:serine/threonine protein kinase KIN1/2
MQARRTARRDMTRTSDVPEEADENMQDDLDIGNAGSSSPTGFKPVYLKGVFSVSTTSSKPIQFIRNDIIRVLSQLGVEYAEIKGGFRCRHAPSIKSPTAANDENTPPQLFSPGEPGSGGGHKRKISFGGFNRTADRDNFRASQPPAPRHKSSRDPTSYENTEDESDEDLAPVNKPHNTSNAARVAGETSTHVQSDLGESMVLKFEIFVVKVPLIGLHGIQFKKIDGGTWQYKNMAQAILDGLRL